MSEGFPTFGRIIELHIPRYWLFPLLLFLLALYYALISVRLTLENLKY